MKGSSQRDMSLGPLSLGLVYKLNQSIERTICSLSLHNKFVYRIEIVVSLFARVIFKFLFNAIALQHLIFKFDCYILRRSIMLMHCYCHIVDSSHLPILCHDLILCQDLYTP